MSVTVCNMISAIKNGCLAGRDSVRFKSSKFCASILDILQSDGYINEYKIDGHYAVVSLKYMKNSSVIKIIKSISTPKKPVEIGFKELERRSAKSYSTFIISTNLGVLAHQEAIAQKAGGLLLCEVSA